MAVPCGGCQEESALILGPFRGPCASEAPEFVGRGTEMAPLLIRICLQDSQGQLRVCTVLYLRVQGADSRLTTLSPSLLLSLAWNFKKRRKKKM